MAALHILVGDTKGDRDWLIKAAKRGNRGPWKVPKSAQPGDDAVIFVGTEFLATAQITRPAKRAGRRDYRAPLDLIQLIRRPVSIDKTKESVPGLEWANYPRTYTTPSPAIAEEIRSLIRGAGGHAHLNGDNETAEADGVFEEGATTQVLLTRYERDRAARKQCVRHYGTSCTACGVSFGERYGPDVAGLIHVHHLTPLASIGAQSSIDPVRDLRPVCPNCHAVIHATRPARTIEEVRRLLRERRAKASRSPSNRRGNVRHI
jgi:hypothetical protein